MYTIGKRTVCKLARESNIPRINHKGFAYFEKLSVTTFFAKYKSKDDVKEWLTSQQIEDIYQMTLGTDIYVISKMLLHKNVSTTQIYADLVDATKRESANKIILLE